MYIKNNTLAVIFRMIFLIVCGAGLIIKLMNDGFAAAVILGDFALVSNTLALIYFAYLIIARPGYERGALRGAVTIYMIVTFIIYYYLYFGLSSAVDLSIPEYLLYFITPVMAVADYLLFCRKGSFGAYSPVLWILIPVLFNIMVFIVNYMGFAASMIPYFNLLRMNMIITLLVFLGLGYLLFIADNLLAGRRR